MPLERVYLDYAATTPLRAEVRNAMMPYMSGLCANPSAAYGSAREAKTALEQARERVAHIIGASPSEVYFTSGGTESDNWALSALITHSRRHIVTSAAEHHAVLETCAALERNGCDVSYARVDSQARAIPADVRRLIRRDTALVSVMYANNETGALNDVRSMAASAHEAGVPFHTDAVAACGHVRFNIGEEGLDMLSLSAHKFYGPAGIGVLYISNTLQPRPSLYGGRQERGLRAGSQNVAGAVGLARALELADIELEEEASRLKELKQIFRNALFSAFPSVKFITPESGALPGMLTFAIPGLEAAAAIVRLDHDGIEVAAGAACSTGAARSSHVLSAAGLDEKTARSVLRFTLGRASCAQHADRVVASLRKAVHCAMAEP